MVIDPAKVVWYWRPKFITSDELRREDAARLIDKISAQKSQVREEVLGYIAQVNPDIFIWQKKGDLRLVWDSEREEISQLVWRQISMLASPTPKSELILPPNSKLDIDESVPSLSPNSMNLPEFEMLCNRYFSDPVARHHLLSLFFREKNFQEQNLKLRLYDLLNSQEEEEPLTDNVHSFWITELPDPLLVRVRRMIKWERKRHFSYHYSFLKVQKQHKDKLGSLFPVRLSKTLLSHLWLRRDSVVAFPWEYREPEPQVTKQQQDSKNIQLPHNSKQILEKVFIAYVIELSKLLENIEWFMGVRKAVYIPHWLRSQLWKMKDIEVLWWFENLHEHLESMLASVISYYHPWVISKFALPASQKLNTLDLIKYPSLSDTRVFSENTETWKLEIRKWISLEMDPRVAEHFWFKDNKRLTCSPQLIEHIFSLPDDEEVVFQIDGKRAAISAKMFRRIFHRDSVPDMKTDTNNVLSFSGEQTQ